MVNLFGVNPSVGVRAASSDQSGISTYPSPELCKKLGELPRGARVGIEALSLNDWMDIRAHLAQLCNGNELKVGDYSGYLYIEKPYWNSLIACIQGAGHNIVFLDDPRAWKRYNESYMTLVNHRSKPIPDSEGYQQHLAVCRKQDLVYCEIIRGREILEIERGKSLLEAIAEQKVNVAVVKREFAEYWMAIKELIVAELGIEFESYSKETVAFVHNAPFVDPVTVFTENAEPNQEMLHYRTSLEREISITQQNRVTAGLPKLVGTWEVACPCRGYFEIFIDKHEGTRFEGKAEDIFGTAAIEGDITDSGIDFIKQYKEGVEQAVRLGAIRFSAKRQGEEFFGEFSFNASSSDMDVTQPFYLKECSWEDPVQMSLRWYKLYMADSSLRDNIQEKG